MIRMTLLRHGGRTCGFECRGHAGYAEEGSDIVCSAVSALLAAVANGITEVAGIAATVSDDGKVLRCQLEEGLSEREIEDAQLLFDTLERAVSEIRDEYGQYFKILDREV